jgi:dTMP kinase
MAERRGRFITLEGGEGAGKSTQAARLCDWLREQGHEAVQTREPGGTPGAEQIRGLLTTGAADRWTPVSEALLLYAARADHVARLIRPALERGAWVVCDRFADSTRAYQGVGHGMEPAVLAALHTAALGDFGPELTLILDLPPDAGLARAAHRGGEARFESLPPDFHARLRQGFLDIAAAEPDRCVVIDATQDKDAVSAEIRAAIAARLTAA